MRPRWNSRLIVRVVRQSASPTSGSSPSCVPLKSSGARCRQRRHTSPAHTTEYRVAASPRPRRCRRDSAARIRLQKCRVWHRMHANLSPCRRPLTSSYSPQQLVSNRLHRRRVPEDTQQFALGLSLLQKSEQLHPFTLREGGEPF